MAIHILVVDDDREFREELACYLDEYEVTAAASGDEALAILKRPNEIDLVILDVMMPGRHGTEVLREMKRIDPGLGIIILTGYSSKDVAVEALKGHADDYVEKSADICRIKSVIGRLLDERESRRISRRSSSAGIDVRIRQYLERNCYKKVTLADVSRAVSLSPKYVSRAFRKSAGTGFAACRREIKIAVGKRLLTTTALTVEEIALRIGYRNPESFIRMFKKEAGHTPAAYRSKRMGHGHAKKK